MIAYSSSIVYRAFLTFFLPFIYGQSKIMNPEKIQQLIEQGMSSASVAVSGGEGKYVAEVTSEAFDGLMLIKRHKMVYACVNAEITSGELHALTIIAKTPAELASA